MEQDLRRFPLRGSDILTFACFCGLVVPLSVAPAAIAVLAVALDRPFALLACGIASVAGLYAAFVGSGRIARRLDSRQGPWVELAADTVVVPLPGGPLRIPFDELTVRTGWFTPGDSLGEHTRWRATVEGVQLRLAVGDRAVVLGASESIDAAVDAGFAKGAVARPGDVGLAMWGVDLVAFEGALRAARKAHAGAGRGGTVG